MKPIALMIPLLFACGDGTNKDGSTDTPTGSHVDPTTLENNTCQEVAGSSDLEGAAAYFSGTMVNNNGTISGLEHVFLVANDAMLEHEDWAEITEDYCTITLSVSGSVGDPLGCTICDMSIAIAANLVESESNCPVELQQDYSNLTEEYDIQLLSDGTANWFFHGSGNQFATGTHTETELQYLTEDPQCQWYGTGTVD
jgi:hypothetical protein